MGALTGAQVDDRIAVIVGAAPAVLDTLKELGDALGNDADFVATVTGQLALKANTVDVAAAFEGTAPLSHTHTPPEVGAAPAVHGHIVADISGLGSAAVRSIGTTAGTVAAGDDARLSAASSGKHTVFWPGDAIKGAAANGCTANQETEVTNKPPIPGADFDPTTEQYGRLCGAIPKSADGGTLDVMLIWNNPNAGSGGVVSSVRAAYLSPGAARPDWSGWVELGPVTLATQNMDVATAYAAVTPGGAATDEAILMLEIRRKAADAADTLTVAARCTGAFLRFAINTSSDA